MATVKMTFSLDEATASRLDDAAATLRMPKSAIVRDAIRDYADRVGRLSEAERLRLLGVFDEVVPAIPDGTDEAVDAELAEVRRERQHSGRGTDLA
jgi:metal-responsive CopG/Arc/MetJ family transcriptional regulator